MRRVRTEEMESKVKALYEEGVKAAQIAQQLGIGKTTVYACLKNQGVYTGERVIPEGLIPTIADMYVNQGIGYVAIATQLGYPKRKVRQAILDSGNEVQKPKRERYQIDETAFDVIDNELAAYWLGFIYADGCVTRNDLRIDLHERDKEHLEKIKPFLKTERPLWKNIGKGFGGKVRTNYLFKVGNHHLATSLRQLGILSGRPNFQVCASQIPQSVARHFIRGYLDGDGSIGSKRVRIRFCGQKDILWWIWDTARKQAKTKNRFHLQKYKHTDKIFSVGFFGPNAILFRDFVYANATAWMERKREKADRW